MLNNFDKKKIILLINIFISLAIFLIIFVYQQSLYLCYHDKFWPFVSDVFSGKLAPDQSARFPSLVISSLLIRYLPPFFNINPEDFRIDYIVCSLFSLFYFLIVIAFSQSFFVAYTKKSLCIIEQIKDFFYRKENIFILPLSFLLLSFPYVGSEFWCYGTSIDCQNQFFLGLKQSVVFFEYCGGYLVFFVFIKTIFELLYRNRNLSSKEAVFYTILAFLLGCWSDFLNAPAFFALVILFIFSKDKKNKYLLLICFSFFIGLFVFYVLSGKYGLNNISSVHNYSILEHLKDNILNIAPFLNAFVKKIIVKYFYFWLPAIVSFIIFACYAILRKDKLSREILIFALSITLGWVLTSLLTIFITGSREDYLFTLYFFPLIGCHIIIYSVFLFLGYFYNKHTKLRCIISSFLILITIIILFNFIPKYVQEIKYESNLRDNLHKFEKLLSVYSVFGESAVMPESLFSDLSYAQYLSPQYILFNGTSENYKKNSYHHIDVLHDKYYYRDIMKHNIQGFTIVDDKTADENLNLRLTVLGVTTNKRNFFGSVKFNDVTFYDNISLNIDKINSLKEKYGEIPLLIKAEAYLNYKDKNYKHSLDLFKKYDKLVKFDYDSILYKIQIYNELGQYQQAEKLYLTLIKKDSTNLLFNYKLTYFYYNQNNIRKALEYNLKTKDLIVVPWYTYPSIATMYKKLGNIDKAEEYIDKTSIPKDEFFDKNSNDEEYLKPYIYL